MMGQHTTAALRGDQHPPGALTLARFARAVVARLHQRHAAQVQLNGKPVAIEWSGAAQAALARRTQPLTLELELYFSCMVKKFVHFHESVPERGTIAVSEQLRICFRAVTSTACSMDVAHRLGRQPEMELDGSVVRKLAPKRVWIDHRRGAWAAEYWM
jgi:hypothetical protein